MNELKIMSPNCSLNLKNVFINRYPAKLLVFWDKIIHAQLLNIADNVFIFDNL